jgi:hypothetical protein
LAGHLRHGKRRVPNKLPGPCPGGVGLTAALVALGADFYARRESPRHKQAWLERQLQKLHPGCTITVTISPPRPPYHQALSLHPSFQPAPEAPPTPAYRPTRRRTASSPRPRHRTGQGLLPRAHRGASYRVSAWHKLAALRGDGSHLRQHPVRALRPDHPYPATASAAYPWRKSAAPNPHEHRAAVRRHVRDRLAVKTHAPGQSGHRAPGTAPAS